MTQLQPLDRCWLISRTPPAFVVLGRYGDLILLLPAFMEIKRRTGINPIVIVSKDYASVLEGVSYVTPEIVKEGWFHGMPTARRMAQMKYAHAVVPQWWNDPETAGDIQTDMRMAGARVLQSHGKEWGVDINANPDFGTSMWRRAGFTREEMMTLPLVFDRRDQDREEALFKFHVHSTKPLLLYNFTGVSSPFGYVPEMMRLLANYRTSFVVLDLGMVRAHRIYDLLGLMDRAVGIITTDTATLHLCPAVSTPSIMLIVDGWGSSVPRGNCAFHCKYSEVPKSIEAIRSTLEGWRTHGN